MNDKNKISESLSQIQQYFKNNLYIINDILYALYQLAWIIINCCLLFITKFRVYLFRSHTFNYFNILVVTAFIIVYFSMSKTSSFSKTFEALNVFGLILTMLAIPVFQIYRYIAVVFMIIIFVRQTYHFFKTESKDDYNDYDDYEE